mmetsp:Transcript_1914/g.3882  ORF Transcript_1914/g.3882 Transcript_1914/m.3882 type:complete len:86 (+) Transcript_1914:61-318(+)
MSTRARVDFSLSNATIQGGFTKYCAQSNPAFSDRICLAPNGCQYSELHIIGCCAISQSSSCSKQNLRCDKPAFQRQERAKHSGRG